MPRRCRGNVLFFLLVAAGNGAACWGGWAGPQETSPRPEESETISRWEFGLELKTTADAVGITAAFPIPQDWPEQTVELAATDQAGVAVDVQLVELGTARIAVVRIPKLAGGEYARVVLPITITKRTQIGPTDPNAWVLSRAREKSVRQYLRPSPQIESTHRTIRDLIKQQFAADSDRPAWQQVEAIYRWVRNEIEYQFEETNRSCLEALETKRGDCGEMTGLFIALCRAKGIPARAVWVPEHTYPEFYLEDGQGNGRWFPCQVAGDYQFGSMFEPKPILQKGDSFKMPGQTKATRYAQPTLTAEDAAAPINVHWIMRAMDR